MLIGANGHHVEVQKEPTCWAEDGHATIVYQYLSCVRARNTAQSLLRDVGWCCKEAPLPSKALWRHVMCCSTASQSLSAHFTEVSK